MKKHIVTTACILCTSASSFALQVLDATNGATIFAKISKKETTRIALDQGRIAGLRTREGVLNVSPDPATGQLFVTVPENSDKSVNAFITTESGNTYTLIMTVDDIPSDSIIIKQPRLPSKTPTLSGPTAGIFTNDIKKFLVALVNESAPEGVIVTNDKQTLNLWAEAQFTTDLKYAAADSVAERFILKNISAAPMVLAEREFYKAGVLAVSIETHTLAAGESTKVYIVREKTLND